MGKHTKFALNKKQKMQKLSSLCINYFGKTFEHWNWVVDSGNVYSGRPTKIGAAIELPKNDINGKSVYTDPFIGYGRGESKALEIALDGAIMWMENYRSKLWNQSHSD